MERNGKLALGAVALTGIGMAIGLVWMTGTPTADVASGRTDLHTVGEPDAPTRSASSAGTPAERAPSGVAEPLPDRPGTAALPVVRDEHGRNINDTPGNDAPTGPVDPVASYELALNTRLDVGAVPAGASPAEADKVLRAQVFELTRSVEASVEAQMQLAATAPRAEAKVATSRAAELYDHMASELGQVQSPAGLGGAEAQVWQTTMRRMGQDASRRAAAIRASGLPGPTGR